MFSSFAIEDKTLASLLLCDNDLVFVVFVFHDAVMWMLPSLAIELKSGKGHELKCPSNHFPFWTFTWVILIERTDCHCIGIRQLVLQTITDSETCLYRSLVLHRLNTFIKSWNENEFSCTCSCGCSNDDALGKRYSFISREVIIKYLINGKIVHFMFYSFCFLLFVFGC